jgi:hypothetical protein
VQGCTETSERFDPPVPPYRRISEYRSRVSVVGNKSAGRGSTGARICELFWVTLEAKAPEAGMNRSPRGRSRRSHLVEIAVIAVAVALIYLFVANGGPSAVGNWFGDLMANSGR